jgi:hypothetical protein
MNELVTIAPSGTLLVEQHDHDALIRILADLAAAARIEETRAAIARFDERGGDRWLARLRSDIEIALRPAPRKLLAEHLGILPAVLPMAATVDREVFLRVMLADIEAMQPPAAAVPIAARILRMRGEFLSERLIVTEIESATERVLAERRLLIGVGDAIARARREVDRHERLRIEHQQQTGTEAASREPGQ